MEYWETDGEENLFDVLWYRCNDYDFTKLPLTQSPPTFLANVKKEKKENLFAVIWHEYNKLFSFRQQLVP